MKRILLFAYAVCLCFFPASLLAQGAPIKPGQLQTKPAVPSQPIKGLEGLDEKIRAQREQEGVDVRECLNLYVFIESVYNNAESSGERVYYRPGEYGQEGILCRPITQQQVASLEVDNILGDDNNLGDLGEKCRQYGPTPHYYSKHDIGSCPIPGVEGSELSPFIRPSSINPGLYFFPYDTNQILWDDSGNLHSYICVNPTKLHAAIQGCTEELSRHPIRVEIPRP